MVKEKDGPVAFSLNGKWISWAHTVIALAGFIGALIVGCKLHYLKIVKNEHYGYPQEWFPSVSATIGDRYPERSIFQLFIAITSGPRFILVGLWYLLTAKLTAARPGSFAPKFVGVVGLLRTFLCGGWVYITSTDDHDFHDIFMISYLVCTLPWTLGCLALSPPNRQAIKYRKVLASLFFGTLVPLIYYFIQHKVHKVAGAYTKYAFFEWSLIIYDVLFDAVTAIEFEGLQIQVVDTNGLGKGQTTPFVDTVAEKSKHSSSDEKRQVGEILSTRFSAGDLFDAAAEVYTGFVFWSILTSLGVTVWYFPLWHMGISGYEALIMTSVAPYFLGINPFQRFVGNNTHIFHLLSLLGIAAYFVTEPVTRLFGVGAGVFFTCLSYAGSFFASRQDSVRMEAKISGFSLGLLASAVAKFANHTNNPIWPIMNADNGGWNKTGLVLAILAVLRAARNQTAGGGNQKAAMDGQHGSFIFPAFGLAGLLFGLHSMLSDSSTMITWVWDGFPIKGPIAVPHGAYTLLAMGAGFLIGMFKENWASSWSFYGIGCFGTAILYKNPGWLGYYGALVLATYLMALVPSFIKSAAKHPPARTFGTAFLIYNIVVLAHVWVVAYAFVPGGPLLRERTDIVLTLTMLLIGAGVFSANVYSQSVRQRPEAPNRRRFRSYFIYILLTLEVLSGAIAYIRFPTFDYTPYHPEDKVLTAGIWTVHFALDNDMWSSERRMRDVIKELEIDVIGLLESDLQRIIMGNRDMTQFLAEDLGMYADFGPGPNKHTWGAALLSKFPIVNSTHHLLPSPVGELAPAILATLDVYGEMIDVLVFHSGQEEDVEDRRLQSEGIAKLMGDSPRPLILLSYLVSKPLKGNYNTYVSEQSRMKDIDPTDWDRWCEYILYRDIKRIGYARVSRSTITDTEIQVGKFVVGDKEVGTESTNRRVKEREVRPGWRFPDMFKGKGVRGHHYHVFKQPRYFA
ncbi:calcofluor white hypersensitive protein precursor [Ascobolus immersus RN42]|uniref:Calcofluor white hypersensitive protein n=1 Tax=Ascobolus immersus RN42 TaxID=1160509 RepID=A0A3N4IF42_ASCIM|nr:calcofluor white hypersensitive protein precursor [Ascobolus immersus RN42]